MTIGKPLTKPKSVVWTPAEVLAFEQGRKTMFRVPVGPETSTVLGYPVSKSKLYWPHLLLEHAVARGDSFPLMFLSGQHVPGRDPHLSVPFQHEDNDFGLDTPLEDMPSYRVRSAIKVGDIVLAHAGRKKDGHWLRIESVKCERVRDIGEEDAIAEGCVGGCLSCGMEPCKCDNYSPDFRDNFIYVWTARHSTRYPFESAWCFVCSVSKGGRPT